MELFKIKDLVFNKEDFLDNIDEFEDIIPIIQDLSSELTYEKAKCTGMNACSEEITLNDCCNKTSENYIVEIQGFIDEDDEFISKSEIEAIGVRNPGKMLDLFVITVHKCVECNKWVIGILEDNI